MHTKLIFLGYFLLFSFDLYWIILDYFRCRAFWICKKSIENFLVEPNKFRSYQVTTTSRCKYHNKLYHFHPQLVGTQLNLYPLDLWSCFQFSLVQYKKDFLFHMKFISSHFIALCWASWMCANAGMLSDKANFGNEAFKFNSQ